MIMMRTIVQFKDAVFHRPHFSESSVLARVMINFATALWGIQVLWKPEALDAKRFPFYDTMLRIMNEDLWAVGALILVCVGFVRMILGSSLRWWGSVGYAAMSLFWVYMDLSYVLEYRGIVHPSSFASLTVLAVLSVYAFVSNPRTK